MSSPEKIAALQLTVTGPSRLLFSSNADQDPEVASIDRYRSDDEVMGGNMAQEQRRVEIVGNNINASRSQKDTYDKSVQDAPTIIV